jgi:hypothetical protein
LRAVTNMEPPGERDVTPQPPRQEYRTVVEAVTPVIDPDDMYATAGKPDPLTRCISAVIEQVRAYRAALSANIPELTYERIFPIVTCLWREISTSRYGEGPLAILLSHTNLPFGPPEIIGDDEHERYSQAIARLLNNDPLFCSKNVA